MDKRKVFEAIKAGKTTIKFTYSPDDLDYRPDKFTFVYGDITFRSFSDCDFFQSVTFIEKNELELVKEGFEALEKEIAKIEEVEDGQ